MCYRKDLNLWSPNPWTSVDVPFMSAFKITPQGPVSQTGPNEVQPEGPFISRFRNILHTSIFKANWKQEEESRKRDREKEPVPRSSPTSYPPLHAPQLQATSGIPQPECLLQSPLSLSPSQAILSGSYPSILPNSVKLHFLNIDCVIIQPQEHKSQH